MLISKAEMDALRIVGMFMDAPAKMLDNDDEVFNSLLEIGYLKLNKSLSSLRLTEAGAKILSQAKISPRTYLPATNGTRLQIRRHQGAQAAIFFNSLDVDIFSENVPVTIPKPLYLSASELRRQNYANVLGMSKFIGLLYTDAVTYAVYNVTDPAETFFPHTDEEIFRREIISANNPAKIIYLGSNLNEMIKSFVNKPTAKKKTKTTSNAVGFYGAVTRFSAPVCFVPMDALGTHQIRIMLVENYREKLTKYMLSVSYHSILADFIDARYGNTDKYFTVFIDFDIKRLQTALRMVPKLDILVLKEQVPALKCFLNSPNARICSIKTKEAFEVLGIPPLEDKLYTPYTAESEDNKCIFASRMYKKNIGEM